MTIYLCNKEPIDLNAIAVMGVSVKVNDSPIGFFGTGLKYAIATLLRTGHQVSLIREGVRIPFGVAQEMIRGEEFGVVTMDGAKLGFTTAMGRNWEPWQAYRELRSNCIDEEGIVTTNHLEAFANKGMTNGEEFGTIFVVTGDAFELCHTNRRDIFLEGSPLSVSAECAIHAGEGDKAFYRGVRAAKLQWPSVFTYNIKHPTELTEDRTIKHHYMIEYFAKNMIVSCDDEDLIEAVVMAPKGTFEHQFSFESVDVKPSIAFMDVLQRNHRNVHCNLSAVQLWRKISFTANVYEPLALDEYEMEQLEKALALVHRLGAKINLGEFWVVEGLGESIYGCVRDNHILIAKCCFDIGYRFVASTIYEEWLHKFEGLSDEGRPMQNRLFEQLLAITERLMALEKKR